ncbi:MAG: NADH:ubiquinone oxidoreductase [Candidatus Thiodiazotropha sp.]|nr:NADH-quinone oxidoreductase subunit B [Candidatus Thiodiazotropha sp. (ex Lucina pensylvanica)]
MSSLLKRASARSPWLYRINAGSCNGCDVELATTALIPRFDVERLGCKYCGSPKHADIVLITGLMTTPLKDKVMKIMQEIPEPKVTVAVGVCPVSGCVYADSYAVEGPVDEFIPIDINILGCPPRPQAIIAGLARAIEIWRERV